MSDADTDAVATTPRSQYLSPEQDQLSPREPSAAKVRAAGYQSPLLSPRNLKAAAAALKGDRTPSPHSAAGSHGGFSPRPGSPAAAAVGVTRPPPQQQQQPPAASAASAAGSAAASIGRQQQATTAAEAAPQHPQQQQQQPAEAGASSSGVSSFAAAATAVPLSGRQQEQQQHGTQVLLARPVTSPFAAVSAMHPMYGMSRDSSMSLGPRAETHVDSTLQPRVPAPEPSLALTHTPPVAAAGTAAAPDARPAPTVPRPHPIPDIFDATNPLAVTAPTPQPSLLPQQPRRQRGSSHQAGSVRRGPSSVTLAGQVTSQVSWLSQFPSMGWLGQFPSMGSEQKLSAEPPPQWGAAGGGAPELKRYAAASYSAAIRNMAIMQASQQAFLERGSKGTSKASSVAATLQLSDTYTPRAAAVAAAAAAAAEAAAVEAVAAAAAAVAAADAQAEGEAGGTDAQAQEDSSQAAEEGEEAGTPEQRPRLSMLQEMGSRPSLIQSDDSKDLSASSSSGLSPAPTSAAGSGQATLPFSPTSALQAPHNSTAGSSRAESLPSLPTPSSLGLSSLPTLPSMMDSQDSFACPGATVDFVVPAGWRSRSIHSSMCMEGAPDNPSNRSGGSPSIRSRDGQGADLRSSDAAAGSTGNSSNSSNRGSNRARSRSGEASGSSSSNLQQQQWMVTRDGQVAARCSALAGSGSVVFKRRSRTSNSGEVAGASDAAGDTAAAAAPAAAGGSSGTAATGGESSRRRLSSSLGTTASGGSQAAPAAAAAAAAAAAEPSSIVKAASKEDKLAARAFRTLARLNTRTGGPMREPARLSADSSLSRRLSSAEAAAAGAAMTAAVAAPADPLAAVTTAFEVEVGTAAAAAGPSVAAAAAAEVRTALAAVPAAAAAVARRVASSPMGRRGFMLLSLLLIGGLWALVATFPGSVSAGLAGAGSAAAPATGTTTAVTTAATAAAPALPAVTAAGSAAGVAGKASAAGAAAAAATAAAGFAAAAPGGAVVAVGVPSVNAYLASQGAAAVVAGYLDPAQLAAVAAPTAAECAKMAGLPFAQLLCT